MKLDHIDHKILRHLQENARITNAELADRVGLSPTPCLRRLRRLETDGIIRGYHTEIDREALGVNVTVIILVKLEREDDKTLREFENAIKARDEVMECYLVTGKFDYFHSCGRSFSGNLRSVSIRNDVTHAEHCNSGIELHPARSRAQGRDADT